MEYSDPSEDIFGISRFLVQEGTLLPQQPPERGKYQSAGNRMLNPHSSQLTQVINPASRA